MSFIPLSELRNVLYGIYDHISRLSFLAEVRDAIGGIRVSVANTPAVTVTGTLTTVTTVTTVTTLGNQTSIGGVNAQPQIPALMNLEAMNANIDNINIT